MGIQKRPDAKGNTCLFPWFLAGSPNFMLVDPENQHTRWQEQGKILLRSKWAICGRAQKGCLGFVAFPVVSNEVSFVKPYLAMQRPVILWFSFFSGLVAEKFVSSH